MHRNETNFENEISSPNGTSPRRFFERLYGNTSKTEPNKSPIENDNLTNKSSISQSTFHSYNYYSKDGITSPVSNNSEKNFYNNNYYSPEALSNLQALNNPFLQKCGPANDLEKFRNTLSLYPEVFHKDRYGTFGLKPNFLNAADVHLTAGFTAFLARKRRKEGRAPRRQRTTFSNDQTLSLEMEYNRNEYISRNKRYELAESLKLSETQIKIWFQNRRAKDKRIEKAQLDQQYRQLAVATGFINQQPRYTSCLNNVPVLL